MKAPERERRDWRLTFLILLIGLTVMCLAGEFALKMAPQWNVKADMESNLNPDATFAAYPTVNVIEQVLPEIETPISYQFLTPATKTVIVTATATFLPGTPSPTLEKSHTPTASITWTPTITATATRTPTPSPTSTSTATPTRTYPPPTRTPIPPTPTYTSTPTFTFTPIPTAINTPVPGCILITGSGNYTISSSGWLCFQTDGTNNGAILTLTVPDLFSANGGGLLWFGKAEDQADTPCGFNNFTYDFGIGIDTVTIYTVKPNPPDGSNPPMIYIFVSNPPIDTINVSVDNPSWSTSGSNCLP